MTEYANRGRNLEHAIRELFKQYQAAGIHCQQNHPEVLQDGTFARKHGFDFQMLFKGVFYAFDAKECNLKSWPLDKAKPHQLKALLDVENNGGKAFFLVHFKFSKKLVKFRASFIQGALAHNMKSVSPDLGETTTINLLGIRQVNPCGYSCVHARNYGEGYLYCTKSLSYSDPGTLCPNYLPSPWSGGKHEND